MGFACSSKHGRHPGPLEQNSPAHTQPQTNGLASQRAQKRALAALRSALVP